MMMLHIGFGSFVLINHVIAVAKPDSAPIKRIINEARDQGKLVDATYGKRTEAVIFTDSGHVILSARKPETLARRVGKREASDETTWPSSV
jgi:hypothetical protein